METAELLASAFVDDPLHVWAIGGERETRLRKLRWLMGALLEPMALRHEVIRDDPGVAVWRPPGVAPATSRWDFARSRLKWAPFRVGIPAVLRLREAGLDMERHERTDTGGRRHWTLELVAVDPTLHGHGHGSHLVVQGLRRAATDDCLVYAVTHNPANVAWFERLGFDVVDEHRLASGSGPRVWSLVHLPAP